MYDEYDRATDRPTDHLVAGARAAAMMMMTAAATNKLVHVLGVCDI